MRKREFMNRLEQLLMDLSYEEKIEALQFYEDYFADAGDDKEEAVIEELGSPEELANIIKNEIYGNIKNSDSSKTSYAAEQKSLQYPEKVSEGYKEQYDNEGSHSNGGSHDNRANYEDGYSEYKYGEKEKKKMTGSKLTLLIIGAVFLGPVIIGLAAAAFGVLVGIFAVIGSLLITFCIAGIACIIGGVALVIVGLVNIVTLSLEGALFIGAGLTVFGVGFLFMAAFLLMLRFIIWIFNKTIGLFGSLFNRRRVYV